MPFTPSHAAAALPLSRVLRRLPLAALVIGSMAPDFEYVIRLAPRGRFGHSLIGLFVFCLPVGLAAYLVFDRVVRPALVQLLPPGLAAAVGPHDSPHAVTAGHVAAAALAVLVGAMSHVGWDGFTHGARWAEFLVPQLSYHVFFAPNSGVRWYKVLQHVSTVVGAAVIAVWIGRWVRRQPPEVRTYPPDRAAASVRVVAGVLAAAAIAGLANALRAPSYSRGNVLGYLAVGAMSGLAVALVVYGMWTGSRDDRHR